MTLAWVRSSATCVCAGRTSGTCITLPCVLYACVTVSRHAASRVLLYRLPYALHLPVERLRVPHYPCPQSTSTTCVALRDVCTHVVGRHVNRASRLLCRYRVQLFHSSDVWNQAQHRTGSVASDCLWLRRPIGPPYLHQHPASTVRACVLPRRGKARSLLPPLPPRGQRIPSVQQCTRGLARRCNCWDKPLRTLAQPTSHTAAQGARL